MSQPFFTDRYELAHVSDCRARREALALPEILQAILEYLPHDSLRAAMRVNQWWFVLATDVRWRDVHPHYLHYIALNRQQYYAHKMTKVKLADVQARNAYATARYLQFPRIQEAVFEGDGSEGSQDPKFLYPYLTDRLRSVVAYNFDLGPTFFDMLHRAPDLRVLGFSISPATKFPDYDDMRIEPIDRIRPEPNLNDLIAREPSAERVTSAKSLLALITNRRRLNRVILANGMDHLITKQLLLAIAQLKDLKAFMLWRPLSDSSASQLAAMSPPPFRSVQLLTIRTQSYTFVKIAPLFTKLRTLRLTIRDAEIGKFYKCLSTLTSLESLHLEVPSTTKALANDLTYLSPLTNIRVCHVSYNDIKIPWLDHSMHRGVTDDHLRIMVASWSFLEELSLPFGLDYTQETFFALGHCCPRLKSLALPQINEFSPFVFEPIREPLFPHLHTLKLGSIRLLPPPPPPLPVYNEIYDEWNAYVSTRNSPQQSHAVAHVLTSYLHRPVSDRTINKFMPSLLKHFPSLTKFFCPKPTCDYNFLYRSWVAVTERDADPDNKWQRDSYRWRPRGLP